MHNRYAIFYLKTIEWRPSYRRCCPRSPSPASHPMTSRRRRRRSTRSTPPTRPIRPTAKCRNPAAFTSELKRSVSFYWPSSSGPVPVIPLICILFTSIFVLIYQFEFYIHRQFYFKDEFHHQMIHYLLNHQCLKFKCQFLKNS